MEDKNLSILLELLRDKEQKIKDLNQTISLNMDSVWERDETINNLTVKLGVANTDLSYKEEVAKGLQKEVKELVRVIEGLENKEAGLKRELNGKETEIGELRKELWNKTKLAENLEDSMHR